MAWFSLRGYRTAVPVEPEKYDLLAELPSGGIQRVQVKSTTFRTGSGKWQVQVGRRPYSLDKAAGRAPYRPDDLDYFFVVCGDGGLFLIPSLLLAGRVTVYVNADAYRQFRVGNASSLLTWNGGKFGSAPRACLRLR